MNLQFSPRVHFPLRKSRHSYGSFVGTGLGSFAGFDAFPAGDRTSSDRTGHSRGSRNSRGVSSGDREGSREPRGSVLSEAWRECSPREPGRFR